MLYLLWYSVIILQPDLFAFLLLNAATSYQKHVIIRYIFLQLQREMLKKWSAVPQSGPFFLWRILSTSHRKMWTLLYTTSCRMQKLRCNWFFFLELKYSLSAPRLLCLKPAHSCWIDCYLRCTANLGGPCEVWTELRPRPQTMMNAPTWM